MIARVFVLINQGFTALHSGITAATLAVVVPWHRPLRGRLLKWPLSAKGTADGCDNQGPSTLPPSEPAMIIAAAPDTDSLRTAAAGLHASIGT